MGAVFIEMERWGFHEDSATGSFFFLFTFPLPGVDIEWISMLMKGV